MGDGRSNEWDGTITDKLKGMDFGLWAQQKWSGGKIM